LAPDTIEATASVEDQFKRGIGLATGFSVAKELFTTIVPAVFPTLASLFDNKQPEQNMQLLEEMKENVYEIKGNQNRDRRELDFLRSEFTRLSEYMIDQSATTRSVMRLQVRKILFYVKTGCYKIL